MAPRQPTPEPKSDSLERFGRPGVPCYQPRAKTIPRQKIGPGDGVDDLNARRLRPYVNPNLKYHLVHTAADKTENMVKVGSHGFTDLYVCGSARGDCNLVASQDPFDGRKAFSNFVLFVCEALNQSGGGGGGSARSSSGASFV